VGLAGVYDPVVRATMREHAFRSLLLEQTLAPGMPARALDLGTGTGSFALALKDASPVTSVTGLDPDPRSLARARAKDTGRRVQWVQALVSELPFADNSFQVITSSLMFHHLASTERPAALRECRRVLVPGGHLQILDWGAPTDPLMWLAFLAIRVIDGFARTAQSAAGTLAGLIAQAGFSEVRHSGRLRTCWGTLELIGARAQKASASGAGYL
jgi:ubiquinone/menaquinone biosynthesis C-methylase UbiE